MKTDSETTKQIKPEIEKLREPIQNALYATNRFFTDECTELTDGILIYIQDARPALEKAIEALEYYADASNWVFTEGGKKDLLLETVNGYDLARQALDGIRGDK